MRLVTYQDGKDFRLAACRENGYVDLNRADPSLPASMKELIAGGEAFLEKAEEAAARGEPMAASTVTLAAPIPDPEKVVCVGLNYADHAKESGVEPPPEPVIFNKFPTAITAHEAPIVLPAVSQRVDYEAELVVVIGRGGRDIPEKRAPDHVAGYTCGHDVSARDWQLAKPGGQWLLGKSFDTFAPCGPHLVTRDEIPEPGKLDIRLRIDGETMQESNTEQLIFSVPTLIAYISAVATLSPGDLIFTGTPLGVGDARKPPVYLQPGNVVEIEIEKIGVLRNIVQSPAGG